MSKNDVVIIELDRPRELRYGHKALKTMSAISGLELEEIEKKAFSNFDMIEKLAYCGLLYDAKENNETLTIEQMEDLLDHAPDYRHIIEKLQAAYFAAFGVSLDDITEGNLQNPEENPGKRKNSTGKSH